LPHTPDQVRPGPQQHPQFPTHWQSHRRARACVSFFVSFFVFHSRPRQVFLTRKLESLQNLPHSPPLKFFSDLRLTALQGSFQGHLGGFCGGSFHCGGSFQGSLQGFCQSSFQDSFRGSCGGSFRHCEDSQILLDKEEEAGVFFLGFFFWRMMRVSGSGESTYMARMQVLGATLSHRCGRMSRACQEKVKSKRTGANGLKMDDIASC